MLFIGNYNRIDYLSLLQECLPYIRFSFLYFTSEKEEANTTYQCYGNALYWKDYKDAYELLDKIKPTKVIFLEIDTYNQVAINAVCKSRSIKTFLLDHGVRHTSFSLAFEQTKPKQRLLQKIAAKFNSRIGFTDRIRTRLFFLNTIKKSDEAKKTFLKSYFRVRSKNSLYDSKKLLPSPYLLPDTYLSFSRFVYQAHLAYDAPPENQEVLFTGIPYFDQLANIQPLPDAGKKVLFIDQAFVTQAILGWTPELKLQFNRELASFCERHQLELLVKEHPLEKNSMWNHVHSNNLVIDNSTPIEVLAASVQVVIGFYSTLLLGLAALPHITLLAYEGHPGGSFELSEFLVSRGVSTAFRKTKELDSIFANLVAVQTEQVMHKEAFIEECLYRFDGQSGERLKQYLLE